MPGLDGFEVLRRIQFQPELHDIRVVVLTASNDVRDMNEAFTLGAEAFVIKPTDFLRFVEFTEAVDRYWAELSNSGQVVHDARGYQLKLPLPVSHPIDPKGNGNGKCSDFVQ